MSNGAVRPFPKYGTVLSDDAFHSKLALSDETRRLADEIERRIASDPKAFAALSKPVGMKGETLVYEHPGSALEITFEVDEAKERVVFFRFAERQLRLRKTIFISYSHKDRIWKDKLRQVFQILEKLGEISFWDDSQIEAGSEWQETLGETLTSANAAILLVSDAFLDSEFVKTFELPRILEEQKKRVFWIALSKSAVHERAPRIATFQSLSTNPDVTLNDLLGLGEEGLNSELLQIATRLAEAIN
jgi:hypothetical protein